jgi:hypothetical protein
VHRGHGSEGFELAEDRQGNDVSGVQDQAGPLEDADALRGQPAFAARQVRVSKERDQLRSDRNSPSR